MSLAKKIVWPWRKTLVQECSLKMNLVSLVFSEINHSNFHFYAHTDLSDIEDILTTVPDSGDYSPFQSKFHALAYMLVHSPRPMVRILFIVVCL